MYPVKELFELAVSSENSICFASMCICGVLYYIKGCYIFLLNRDFLKHIYISMPISYLCICAAYVKRLYY